MKKGLVSVVLAGVFVISGCGGFSLKIGGKRNYVYMKGSEKESLIRQKADGLMLNNKNPMTYRKAAKCYNSIGDFEMMEKAVDEFFKVRGDPWIYKEFELDNK